MKNLIYFLFPLYFILAVRVPAASFVIFAVPLFFFLRSRIRLYKDKRRVEPVIIATDTKTGTRVPDHLKGIIYLAPKGREIGLFLRLKKRFEKSNDMAAKGHLPIELILSNDGKYVGETDADYNDRLIRSAESIRAEFHERMKTEANNFYLAFHHKQKSFEWDL